MTLLTDAEALKNPGAHTSHSGWALIVLGVFVYLPGGHLACSMHLGTEIAVTEMYLPDGHVKFRAAVQESVLTLLFDVETLKNPGAHATHFGGAVIEPDAAVYFPGGHLECAMH